MALSLGEKLGPYEVISLLGKGGMGEVYRARDPQLNRDVAIKVLPAALANDADYLARFQREAQTLASLNHPNIASIYGLEGKAIVMELVEGETLTGPLPLVEALPLARQIAEALEAAHEKGIIHRDLKPGNIKVTPEGVVKVLDFGLAKAVAERATQSGPDSPTLTLRATEAGLILGTAAYMSPEQAAGKNVDRRADIWSFGVVLYELLTGKRLFDGETVTHTLADVVRAPIDLALIEDAQLRHLIGRCLDRNIKTRLQHIGEARIAIENYAPAQAQASAPTKPGWWPWAAAGVATLALAAVSLIHFRQTPAEQPVLTMSILPPGTTKFSQTAISPDGKLLAFTATAEGRWQLWVRPLHSLTAQPLAGTEQAADPFWSPDSRWIGFFSQGKLKKIEASGGPAQTLCEVGIGRGGAWNQDGVIVYGYDAGLWRVAAQGGTPAQLTALDRAKGEASHRWPVFLPGGRRYVYLARGSGNTTGIYLGALNSKERTKLMGDPSSPGYAEGPAGEGYLLFVRETVLMAQRFDAGEGALTGGSFPVAEKVGLDREGVADFSVSGNGMMVYGVGTRGGQRLTWMDRAGKRLETLGGLGILPSPALSPDGKQVAFRMAAAQGQGADIWVRDLARDIPTRFTFHPSNNHTAPVWSPDGSRIVFASSREGPFNLYLKSASGAGQEERLLKAEKPQIDSDWTDKGDLLLYYEEDPRTKYDLWVLPMTGERKPAVFLKTEFNEAHGVFSPDGKWIAYSSDESGRYEIYVQPYPATGAKWQVSRDGGRRAKWRLDGGEIYWLGQDGTLMAAEVSLGQTLHPGNAMALFETGITSPLERFAVTADGQRFLVPAPAETEDARPVTVVWNWLAGAKR